MAKYTWANLDKWAKKVEQRADLIVKQSANDLIVMASRTKPGKIRGGNVQVGFIPRDLGGLAASLVTQLNGSTIIAGETSYIAGIAGFNAGGQISFGWTAAYARAQHYKGWLWVDNAVQNWPSIVRAVVARAKAMAP